MGKGNGISTTQHKVVWRSRLAGKLPFMETRITDKVKENFSYTFSCFIASFIK